MGTMSVEVPEIDQLLAMTSPARYGDELPDEGGRGGALHLSSVLPAISSAIGHPIPTAIHADPKRLQEGTWPGRTRVRQSWSWWTVSDIGTSI